MSVTVTAAEPVVSSAEVAPFPYQQVDGLQEIYVGLGGIVEASFVFETAAKAEAVAKAIDEQIAAARRLQAKTQQKDPSVTALLDITEGENLSPVDSSCVVSYTARQLRTIGRPIRSPHQLLLRIGSAMKIACAIPKISKVPILGVDNTTYLD